MKKQLVGVLLGVIILFVFNTIVYADIPKEVFMELSDNDFGYRDVRALKQVEPVKEPSDNTYNVMPYQGVSIPSTYRTPNLPTIRNQGQYGTCWAFSAVGLGELSIAKQENISLDLSERHLTFFTYNTVMDPLGGTAGDKNEVNISGKTYLTLGGNLAYSTQALATWQGFALEERFPYRDATQPIEVANAYGNNAAHLQNAFFINLSMNTSIAKEMIMKYGGMGISFYADGSDNSSFYNSNKNAYYCSENKDANHEVIVVGWDDNFSKDNFKNTPPGNGAWLIRNSWGTNGDCLEGYFWISYYDMSLSKVGFVYDVVSKDSDRYYDHNYLYDGSIEYGSVYCWNSITGANIFTSKFDNEQLKAVSFGTYYTNDEYQISIYKNLRDMTNPESGDLVATISGATTCEGIYTIPLAVDNYVTLQKDDTYSVVVKLSHDRSYSALLTEKEELVEEGMEEDSWVNCTVKAEAGQSFIFLQNTWRDYGKEKGVNIRIKAYTNDIIKTIPVTNITIRGDSEKMQLGERDALFASLLPVNATNQTVIWSSTDNSIATVDSEGNVTAKKCGIVSVIAASGDGKVRDTYKITVYPSKTKVNAVWNQYTKSVSLTWNKIEGVDGYRIIRKNANGSNLIKDCIGDSVTSYMDNSVNRQYIYVVQPYIKLNGETLISSAETMTVFNIKYIPNGGSSTRNPNQYNYKTSGFTLANPIKDGYTFLGWYADANYKIRKTMIRTTDYGNITLFAKWIKNKYSIAYNLNGGVNNRKNPTYYYITTSTFTLDKPTRIGYTFSGWYTSNRFKRGTKISKISKGSKGKIIVYAKWTVNTYNIKLSDNKAKSGTVKKIAKRKYGTTYKLPANTFKRKGYIFTGWNTKSNGKGKVYKNKASIKNLSSINGKTITLYAQWEKK